MVLRIHLSAYLEEGDIWKDVGNEADDFGIVVEQLSPMILAYHKNRTVHDEQPIPCVQKTHLLRKAVKILRPILAFAAHLASQPLPAPSRFPTRTAEAIPIAMGTWYVVEQVTRRTDCAASATGPRREAARAQASHAHHSDESCTVSQPLPCACQILTMIVPASPSEVTVPSLAKTELALSGCMASLGPQRRAYTNDMMNCSRKQASDSHCKRPHSHIEADSRR